jgi:hypothetical protein
MADRYRRTSAEIVAHREPGLALNVEEKIRRATPVQDPAYLQMLDRAHREGRRLEVGEASPNMLGTHLAPGITPFGDPRFKK